eukprot:EG_transcript_8357
MVTGVQQSPGPHHRLTAAADAGPRPPLVAVEFEAAAEGPHSRRLPHWSLLLCGVSAAFLMMALAGSARAPTTLLPITSAHATHGLPRLLSRYTVAAPHRPATLPALAAIGQEPQDPEGPATLLAQDSIAQSFLRRLFLGAAGVLFGVALGLGQRATARPGAMLSVAADGTDAAAAPEADLLVVGCGVLGRMVAQEWRAVYGSRAAVVGETLTETAHAALRGLGIEPQVAGTRPDQRFSHVIFCVPAGNNEDYAQACARAAARWNGKGNFVFTSSAGVYAEDNGGIITEDSPLQRGVPRIERILAAEQACLGAGGVVVRLAGLYTADRGPHPFWLKMPQVQGSADGLINMIAYEDAAALCVQLLRTPGIRREVFLAGDGVPITRQDICRSARRLKRYAEFPLPTFVGEGGLGKRYDTSKLRRLLAWRPKYESFDAYITQQLALE